MRIVLPAFGLLLLLSSCNLFEKEETFVDASVAAAVNGTAVSETNTFRLADYDILAEGQDHLLLKAGNAIQIVAATGYQDSVARFGKKPDALLVKKWTNPYPHFRLRGYEVDGTRHDGSFVIAASELPILMDRKLYDTSFFQTYELAAWEEEMPDKLMGNMIGFVGSVERVVIDSTTLAKEAAAAEKAAKAKPKAPAAPAADEAPAPGTEAPAPPKETVRYYISSGNVRVQIENTTEPGVRLLLDGMISQGKKGAFYGTINEVSPPKIRKDTKIYGKFQLSVFDFANRLCVLR